ncbi:MULTISPECIES: nuclease-related domain-containing protein [unclassified Cryobacterium]|uniref:nuclease-related domain-containing protein n=1 Tax=unclassified Cryobacterium TaxID=2649013 RepID=UPI002AB51544|nr:MULTISPECIES: nuclease-related domain-containing protein [unclassified Cryobacterium]MDY7541180.1 nuclease-related domain-containing protein [Cryobacterium sp. 5B3]MEB0267073.1 nuclease-related domain-containing protein [Cryobacterium sp. 10I5]MEB0274249.1 nuclease-related domain-containing protein [Cryobacterium sp. 5B3]
MTEPGVFVGPIALGAGFAATAGAISSVPISFLRMLRDPYRRELIRFTKEKATAYAAAQTAYESARLAFDARLRMRPANAQTLLTAPFSQEAVRAATPDIRRWLDEAIAQEDTARALAKLGPQFSVWHDLEVGAGNTRINHLVVGPQGLILIESMTARGPVTVEFDSLVQHGRMVPEVLDSLRPRLTAVARAFGIGGVSILLLVYPEAVLVNSRPQRLGGGPVPTFVVGSAELAAALVQGLPGIDEGVGWQLDRLRDNVSEHVRFA